MREIKFRIRLKNKTDGKVITMFNSIFDEMNGIAFFEINRSEWEFLGADEYTGLKDKNGKEIYEGDILKRGHENNPTFLAIIKFNSGGFYGVTIPNYNHSISIHKLKNCDYDGKGYDEVIANIHDNPELLK